MATCRRFCRFNRQPETASFAMTEITGEGRARSVLMGKLNPEADWEHIGGVDISRVLVHSRRWMLPSCHLTHGESPQEAARRISSEQLEEEGLDLREPTVISYVDKPKRFPEMGDHWDLEFVFRGELAPDNVSRPAAWKELRLVDLDTASKTEVARSHEDILESLGLRLGGS